MRKKLLAMSLVLCVAATATAAITYVGHNNETSAGAVNDSSSSTSMHVIGLTIGYQAPQQPNPFSGYDFTLDVETEFHVTGYIYSDISEYVDPGFERQVVTHFDLSDDLAGYLAYHDVYAEFNGDQEDEVIDFYITLPPGFYHFNAGVDTANCDDLYFFTPGAIDACGYYDVQMTVVP